MKKTVKLLCVLLALLSLVSCARATEEAPQLMEPVGAQMDVVTVKRGEICDAAAYQFHVAPAVEEVYYSTDGTIDEVCVGIGDNVQAGDVLLRMDVQQEREQLSALDASIAYTEKDNELTLKMLKIEVDKCAYALGEARDFAHGTKKAQEALDAYERAAASLAQEEERQALQMQQLLGQRTALTEVIARSELIAPVAGSVVYLANDAGEGVRAGSAALVLATEELQLKGEYLSESVLQAADEIVARVGDVECGVEYVPMDEEEYISMLLSGAQMSTRLAFASGAPAGAEAGDYALVLVKTQKMEDVLYLPVNVVERDAQGDYVYRAAEDGGRERVSVTVGWKNATSVQIEAGLQEGDVVYVP